VGIETNGATDAEARELTPRGHAIDVFIVHSQYGRKIRNLDGATPGFQLFNQIEFHAIPPSY